MPALAWCQLCKAEFQAPSLVMAYEQVAHHAYVEHGTKEELFRHLSLPDDAPVPQPSPLPPVAGLASVLPFRHRT